jgi:hypothetical protein
MKDEVIAEVWQAKDELAQQFGYDLDKLAVELRRKEAEHVAKVVDLSQKAQPSKREA